MLAGSGAALGPNAADDALHWAQLKCYGACYCEEHALDSVALSLNRVSLHNRQERRNTANYPRVELMQFVEELLQTYLRWHRLVDAQRR